ncbi:MAG: sulfite exporter TauE/SafE family protein [Bacteroidota bacterium]|nr:sulfite exporter TauE/SafE family protein [Bacteroidota bacterium]
MEVQVIFLICCLFFLVAFLYSSVGHGGASGYLAILSLFSFAPDEMASTALLLNIFVAGIAFYSYYRSGYFSSKLTIPFLITSIPFAFIGGIVHIPKYYYGLLLAIALIAAAFRLSIKLESDTSGTPVFTIPSMKIALPTGGAIGFLSGVVGVGGGIFLSPIILLMRWADPKFTAATSAMFIVVNSIAGIFGRLFDGRFSIGTLTPFLFAAILGGLIGSTWGSKKFSGITLLRLLGVVLIIAAVKLMLIV